MPVVICQPGLWCWWYVAQRGVRSDGVVVGAPAFGQYPQFLDRVEDLRVEELISEFRVERFAVAVLPWRAGFDVQCLCADVGEPLTQVFRHELGTIIRTYVLRNALHYHDIGQRS